MCVVFREKRIASEREVSCAIARQLDFLSDGSVTTPPNLD